MMVTPKNQIEGIKKVFAEAGAKVSLKENDSILHVHENGHDYNFKIPPQVKANDGRIPGWFLAGIWDYVGLLGLNDEADDQLLIGWGFHQVNSSTIWWKPVTQEGDKQLHYDKEDNRLYILNRIANSRTDVGPFPARSPYHAIMLFEENGWFDGQEVVPSLDINSYVVRK